MTREETVTLTRAEYDALLNHNSELEGRLAALVAEDGSRVPHEVAVAIIRGTSSILAFRNYLGVTLRDLSESAGIAVSYLSEIERGHKPGSLSALARVAAAFGTTIDALVSE
jgi:DNA-binding XRE family transcriptional regulator